jgi:hypothetical protein
MPKSVLNWDDLHKLGMRKGSSKAWYPDESIAEYFINIRTPSNAWPHSYARAAQTYKFRDWLLEKRPEIAKSMGLPEMMLAINNFTGE